MKKLCNRLRLRAGFGVDENLPTPTPTPTPVKTTDSGRLQLRLRLRLRSPGFTDDGEFSVHLVDWLVVEDLPAVSFVFCFEISVNYRVFRKSVSTREIGYKP